MSSRHLITLFDLKCTLPGPCWSPNVWRTRFVLNYKNLPYQTKWIPYPDIEEHLRAAGAPPTRTEKPLYTVPAIVDRRPDGSSKAISDTPLIADYLETEYPTPPIFPGETKPIQEEIIKAISQHVIMNMAFMVISTTANILDERDAGYFVPSRKEIFGISVEDMFPEEKRDKMWQNLEKGFDALAGVIAKKGRDGGVWIFGDSPTYADFVLISQFIWLEKAGPRGAWDRVKKWNEGRWEALYTNAEKYMKQD